MVAHRINIVFYTDLLTFNKLLDSIAKRALTHPVQRPCQGRLEASRNFVLALGARIEPGQPLADTIFDPLVIAKFKVQRVDVAVTAPVTAIQSGVIAVHQRPGYHHAIGIFGQGNQD